MTTTEPTPTLEQLQNNDPQTIADQCGIPICWIDHQATRRQRLHGCNIPGGRRAYSSTHLNEVLAHLASEGYQDAILICETPRRTHLACYCTFAELQS